MHLRSHIGAEADPFAGRLISLDSLGAYKKQSGQTTLLTACAEICGGCSVARSVSFFKPPLFTVTSNESSVSEHL